MINSPHETQPNEAGRNAGRFSGKASAARRMVVPYLIGVAYFAVIGLLFGWIAGFVIGLIVGSIYSVISLGSSGSYLYDLHDGELLDRSRAPETYKFTEELAESLGIDPPTIYRMDIDQPQICVSATGRGRRVQGRIGISRGLFEFIHNDQLHVLLALSMARIATGEATLISKATTLASFPMQLAQSKSINFSIGSFAADPECGLNPLGKLLLIVFTPLSRAVLALAKVSVSIMRCDIASTRIGHRSFEPIRVESALRWLQKQQPPAIMDPATDFNPGEAAAYLVSPFENDFDVEPQAAAATVQPPLWKRCRYLVSSAAPSLSIRIAALEAQADGRSLDAASNATIAGA